MILSFLHSCRILQVGHVTVSGTLDREQTAEYQLIVVATDSAATQEEVLQVSLMDLSVVLYHYIQHRESILIVLLRNLSGIFCSKFVEQ